MSFFSGSRCNCCTTATHIITTAECGNCHTTAAWKPSKAFMHIAGIHSGNHGLPLTYSSCHTSNSETIPWPPIRIAGAATG